MGHLQELKMDLQFLEELQYFMCATVAMTVMDPPPSYVIKIMGCGRCLQCASGGSKGQCSVHACWCLGPRCTHLHERACSYFQGADI